jgi:hypothetical protein
MSGTHKTSGSIKSRIMEYSSGSIVSSTASQNKEKDHMEESQDETKMDRETICGNTENTPPTLETN